MTTIVVVGYGVLGKTIGRYLAANGYTVAIKEKDRYLTAIPDVADAAIICVDTPTANGQLDDSNLVTALSWVRQEFGMIPTMVKSTITPDRAELLDENVVYSPEFLRERSAYDDFIHQTFMLLGGADDQVEFWKYVFEGLDTEFVTTSAQAASWCKYIHNLFLATKVIFFHELDMVANRLQHKQHYQEALRITREHNTQIGSSHTYSPNELGTYGVVGKCFPKDMQAFLHYSNSDLIKWIIEYNDKLRTQQPDDS